MNRRFTLFKIHAPNVLDDIIPNLTKGGRGPEITMTLNVLKSYLALIAETAIDINDDRLNAIMCRMTLYSAADPSSPDYDKEGVQALYDKVGIDPFSSIGKL